MALAQGERRTMSLGPWTDVSESDYELQQGLTSAIHYYNNHGSSSDYYFTPSTIIRARRQVFQDKSRYIVDLEMIKTGCRKQDYSNPFTCDLQPERGERRQCHPEFFMSHGEVNIKDFICDP
ncbi:cystatin-M-like [Epinephelus lanceolatus]